MPVPQALTKIVALLGSPGALSNPSRISAMSTSRPASSGGHTSEGRGEWVACRCRLTPLHFTIFHFISQVFTFIAYSTRESFLAFMRVFCQAQDYVQAQNRRPKTDEPPRSAKGAALGTCARGQIAGLSAAALATRGETGGLVPPRPAMRGKMAGFGTKSWRDRKFCTHPLANRTVWYPKGRAAPFATWGFSGRSVPNPSKLAETGEPNRRIWPARR